MHVSECRCWRLQRPGVVCERGASTRTCACIPPRLACPPPARCLTWQFKPAPPLDPASPEFAAQLGEVFQLGRNTSTARTADQADIAHFWADGNSACPGGGWCLALHCLPMDLLLAWCQRCRHARPPINSPAHLPTSLRPSLAATSSVAGHLNTVCAGTAAPPPPTISPAHPLTCPPPSLAATSSVAGHFNAIAQALLPNDTSVADAARLFAELNAGGWPGG